MTRPPAGVAVVLLAALALTGCSGDPQEEYCDAVTEHQGELTEAAASEDTSALFDVLDTYDDLRDTAPRDIVDDWDAVIGPLRELRDVLADHGVDVSSYSSDDPPADLDAEGRRRIEAAARAVGSERTVTAMAAVEQHALDVCGTPLSR